MISLYHVYKSYDNRINALSDISFEIEKGEFVFLTGLTGAGKTTLLRLLFREELPTAGQILVNGKNVAVMKEKEIPFLRREIGVVFQDFKLLWNRSVFDNLAFVLKIFGVSREEIKERVWKILKLVKLQHKINSTAINLSGGEQQRVAIARALINQPRLLLADEPTGNLDPEISQDIVILFESINDAGTTVVFATHDIDLVKRLSKRMIRLDKGKVEYDPKSEIPPDQIKGKKVFWNNIHEPEE
ncbi:MAG: cell division ATP-binding protein FtsE [Candidatus Schekmanbacteria bacterium RBG_13_48_7]|uniref:Cell division ATP-binding protein FtsE n=1 Tax=Candidatus Schekmanbacteria bacterium RBG_13_48_7 TaxID=1817878 RepID=A0A1F7RN44_9BACT|nr:MAG: cell division ATP-binding protein FtsE [Candidatus Schekmanbacteria bacterium RBG_13_48_7]